MLTDDAKAKERIGPSPSKRGLFLVELMHQSFQSCGDLVGVGPLEFDFDVISATGVERLLATAIGARKTLKASLRRP